MPLAAVRSAAARRALARARTVCARRGARLTENREAVLRILLSSRKPVSAYEIVDRFDWRGRRRAPAQIYRAVQFLVGLGLAHRLPSRGTYFACLRGDRDCPQTYLVCESCDGIAELPAAALLRSMRKTATAAGFEFHTGSLEISGLCADCRKARTGA